MGRRTASAYAGRPFGRDEWRTPAGFACGLARLGSVTTSHESLALRIAGLFAPLPAVESVALGGSRAAGGVGSDPASDIDVYVYTRSDIDLDARREIVEAAGGASRLDLGMTFWGPGDEWIDATSGIHVDVSYFDADWMADQLDRVLVRHEASLGYSTCFWHTVRGSILLEDPRGWFAALQARSHVEYPEALRRNVIAFNHASLRGPLPAWSTQVAKAARRSDLVSVNHRLAGLLASYFDVLFAFNRLPHPGEKRLVQAAALRCDRLPTGMAADLHELLETATTDLSGLPARVDRLLDRLDALLAEDGFGVG